MKRIILYTLIVLGFSPSAISAQSLESYLKEAARKNPGLKARHAKFEAAMQKIPQAKTLPDPTFSFGYMISPGEGKDAQGMKFSLRQTFPWFGALAARKKAAALEAEAQHQTFLSARNELFYQVKTAYYKLYETDSKLRWQRENSDVLAAYKQLAIHYFSQGKGGMADVIRVDILLKDVQTQIRSLQEQYEVLTLAFNRLLHRPDALPVKLQEMRLPSAEAIDRKTCPSSETQQESDETIKNPLLTSLELRVQAAKAQEKAAKKAGLPQLGLGLDYMTMPDPMTMGQAMTGRHSLMPTLSIGLPIFRSRYQAAVKEAQWNQAAFSASKKQAEDELYSTYKLSCYASQDAERLIRLYDEQIKNTRQATTLLYTSYSHSGKDFVEVLRMQQELLKYKINKATAVKDFYTALAQQDYITAKTSSDEIKD